MTDREKVTDLFLELGIVFHKDGDEILISAGEGKNEGYTGFFTSFRFDKDGKFIAVGSWE